jgi:hypothetical protein
MVEIAKHQELQQGELSIASDQRRQQFGYDGLGNWLTFKEATTGGWTLDQSRTNNAANEIAGRPLGAKAFVQRLEKLLDRRLLPRKAGRPRKKKALRPKDA